MKLNVILDSLGALCSEAIPIFIEATEAYVTEKSLEFLVKAVPNLIDDAVEKVKEWTGIDPPNCVTTDQTGTDRDIQSVASINPKSFVMLNQT